jgi:hypothetical protein
LQQKEAQFTTTQAERNTIEAQIISIRNSGDKAHTSELNKQLNLEERIYDSKNKQLQASLDARAAEIQDRQAKRDEDVKLRTSANIIKALGGRTDVRAQDFRARAEDAAALIDIERQQRGLNLEEKQATAGARVINGKIYQSKPGGGAPAGETPQATGPITPVGAGLPAGGGAAGASASSNLMTINVLVDGKVAWSGMAPYAWDDLMKGVLKVKAAKGA